MAQTIITTLDRPFVFSRPSPLIPFALSQSFTHWVFLQSPMIRYSVSSTTALAAGFVWILLSYTADPRSRVHPPQDAVRCLRRLHSPLVTAANGSLAFAIDADEDVSWNVRHDRFGPTGRSIL